MSQFSNFHLDCVLKQREFKGIHVLSKICDLPNGHILRVMRDEIVVIPFSARGMKDE